MTSYEKLRKDEEIISYINAANNVLGALGFTENGRRKNYYTRPREDAVLMALALPDPEASEC